MTIHLTQPSLIVYHSACQNESPRSFSNETARQDESCLSLVAEKPQGNSFDSDLVMTQCEEELPLNVVDLDRMTFVIASAYS